MNEDPLIRARALITTLHDARLAGYGAALPGPLDAAFSELARLYAAADDEGRAAIRAAIPADLSLLLLGFSDRRATVAARTGSEQALREAALAHAIEDFRHDPRENIFRLAIVHHVAKKLGVDPRALLERTAALSSPGAARHLTDFAARTEPMKSLKTMRIREARTPDGVVYEYLA